MASLLSTTLQKLKSLLAFCWRNKWKITKYTFYTGTSIVILLFATGYFFWLGEKEAVVKNLDRFKSEVTDVNLAEKIKPVEIYDINKELIGTFYRRHLRPIRVDNLERHDKLVWAVLSSEDREFYNHFGINVTAIARAIIKNITSFGFVQGGSTLTQQLAKISLDLGKRTLFNKIVELYCTFYIEGQYDKKAILAMYLNQVFMGKGNTGMEDASRFYFRKAALDLNQAEAALLAGVIQAPSVYNPVSRLKIALKKQRLILSAMQRHPELNPTFALAEIAKRKQAVAQDAEGKKLMDDVKSKMRTFAKRYNIRKQKLYSKDVLVSDIGLYGYDKDFKINLAPDFNRTIRDTIMGEYNEPQYSEQQLKVYTTLDKGKQLLAQQMLRAQLNKVKNKLRDRRLKYIRRKKNTEASREAEIINTMNSSLISLDSGNGHIRALVGSHRVSRIYRLNRAEQTFRQPGSAIKGLIYALAYDKRMINPATTVVDEKINIRGYSPRNWYNKFKGEMTARKALAMSVNTIPVKLLHEMGVSYFLDKLAEILDVDPADLRDRFQPNLALALGAGELSALELNLIYSTIANGGRKIIPKRIISIRDEQDLEIFQPYQEPTEGVQVIDPIACAMALNSLQAVVSPLGTMHVPASKTIPMAGKTGTVQSPSAAKKKWGNRKGVRDVWFVGILPNLVTAVWIGNDQGAPFPGSGSGTAGRVWLPFALAIHRGGANYSGALVKPFEGEFVQVDICADNQKILGLAPDCKFPLKGQYFYQGENPYEQQLAELKQQEQQLVTTETDTFGEEVDTSKPAVTTVNVDDTIITSRNATEGVELEEPVVEDQ